MNQMAFFLGFERRISLENEVGDEKRQCRTPERYDNTPRGIGLEYEAEEEKQWVNVNSNTKPRKADFTQRPTEESGTKVVSSLSSHSASSHVQPRVPISLPSPCCFIAFWNCREAMISMVFLFLLKYSKNLIMCFSISQPDPQVKPATMIQLLARVYCQCNEVVVPDIFFSLC